MNPKLLDHPDGSEYLKRFEAPKNWGEDFADRIRGLLIPPVTGEYTFWITGRDGGDLLLSRDDDPKNSIQVAYAENSDPAQWTKSASQNSGPFWLIAGRAYYIEARRKCGSGPDHLAVAWQPPGGRREIISGEYLAPLEPKAKP